MNIVFVTIDYPERGKPTTGFPTYLYRVSWALKEMGHHPIILVAGSKNRRQICDGVEIIRVRASRIESSNMTLNYILTSLQREKAIAHAIEELEKKIKVDFIQFTSLNASSMLYRGKVPCAVRLSSYAKTYFATNQTYSKGLVWTMSLFERVAAKKCDAVFAPCKITAKAFERDIRRRVDVIETPFVNDVVEYDFSFYEDNLKGKQYILFFGTMYAEKGILVIADLLEELLCRHKDLFYVFIGSQSVINGELVSKRLLDKAHKNRNRVLIWDALDHKRLYPVIMNAKIVTLPSVMDNFSNACIEAMYFSKVVIGTKGASFEQLIEHKKSGLLCRINDSVDLLEKIEYVLSLEDDEINAMGKMASKRIEQLKPEVVVLQLLDYYRKVIAIKNDNGAN